MEEVVSSANQRKRFDRNRAESSTSHLYFDDHDAVDQKLQSFIETVEATPTKNFKPLQSKPLPYWAWFIIAKVNGVPLRPNEKPIFGTFVHGFTFCCALTYLACYIWYVVYDIMSLNTPRDIPGGAVSIFLVMCWCAFGFYCKTLSSRLFFHRRFLKDVRLHSRTVFKVNASILVVILGLLFTAANIVEALFFLNWKHCNKIELDVLVCTVLSISNIFFSILTFVWHSLVAFVFLSVCRTHTIGLRRFIKEIEHDSAEHQKQNSLAYSNLCNPSGDIWDEPGWLNDTSDDDSSYSEISPNSRDNKNSSSNSTNPQQKRRGEISILLSPVEEGMENSEELMYSENYGNNSSVARPMKGFASAKIESNQIMSHTEILHHYFKLNCRLRFSARALQRWFASFITLVLLRCSTYLVHWLAHTASFIDVVQFVLPLILLVVLSSAIAEVNFEGNRVWQCLYPTEKRLRMLQFLTTNPLVMPIYGFGMTHGTIVTVVFAILVGFVTRIVMTELTDMNKQPKVVSISSFS